MQITSLCLCILILVLCCLFFFHCVLLCDHIYGCSVKKTNEEDGINISIELSGSKNDSDIKTVIGISKWNYRTFSSMAMERN